MMGRSRERLLSALALLLCLQLSGCYASTDDNRPNIRVEGGHLLLQGSPGRNISLSTRGSGVVNLNGVDIVGALTLVRTVRTQLESLDNIELNQLLYNLSSVARAVVSETRLVTRLNAMQHNASSAKAETVSLRNELTGLRSLLDSRYNSLVQNISALRQSSGGGGGGGEGGPSVAELNAAIANINQLQQDLSNYIDTGNTMQVHITNLERQMSHLVGIETRMSVLEDALNSSGLAITDDGELTSTSARDIRRLKSRFRTMRRRVRGLVRLVATNECDSSPCSNGGTCIDVVGKRICICPKNWMGEDCSDDVNECYEFFGTDIGCQNGATCTNTPGGYTCSCTSGWHGVHCTQRANNCSLTSSHTLCGHGTCIPSPRGQHPYTCLCDQGWRSVGPSNPACVVDVDECSESKPPCSHDPPVTCINIPGSFVCGTCPAGYEGNGFYCRDVDECQVNNGGCSLYPRVDCLNTRGSSMCGPCPTGYTGDGRICTQAPPPCQSNPCHPMATCVPISTTMYQCMCPSGYMGNGIGPYGCTYTGGAGGGSGQVAPANPCSPSPCLHGTCAPYGNTYTCTCTAGYTGRNCEADFDECSSMPCLNGGTCTQGLNSYTCRCPASHTGDRCQTEVQSCGGVIRGTSGIVNYPQIHGQNYNHNISCAWVIVVNRTKVINVTFSRFHLEGGRCNFDWLQVHDGRNTNSQNIGRYCGTSLPGNNGTIISTHNALYLWFRSDHSYAGTGFNFTWNATDPVCGGVVRGQEYGSINSPGYPGVYPNNRDCYWTIYVTPGKRIKFHFATLQIEHHPNCSYDFVQVYDGVSEDAVSLGKFCSTTSPPPVTTSGAEAYIHFHTDIFLTDNGFHISFSSEPGIPGCGGLLTGDRGEFSAPMLSDEYRHNMHCEWVVRVHPQETIELNFTDFHIERSTNCRFDWIEVRDGGSSDSPLIGRFCGRQAPATIRSLTNQLYVLFHSDYSVSHDGFTATYEVSCGGKWTSPSGILRSPYHPLSYPHDRSCVYIIALEPGKAIRLNFTEFDIERPAYYYTSGGCIFDYVEIHDGSRVTSPSLGRFCGPPSHRPDPIISTLNYLYIRFVTDGSVSNRGFVANYTSFDIRCGGVLHDLAGHINSPNEEGRYPGSTDCTWVLDMPPGYSVQVTWTAFVLEGGFGTNCQYDYVEVFDNSTALRVEDRLIGRYCGTRNPPTMTSMGNLMTIHFHSDESVSHDGFSALYHSLNLSTACRGNYHTPSGMLSSPNYPQRYPNSVSCEWTITAPAQQQIRLNFSPLDIEEGRNCMYDYLEIRNGHEATSPLIGKYCGRNQTIPEIISHAHTLYIKFHSDMSMRGTGFQVFWDSASTGCGGTMNAVSGEIISPGYPQNSGARAECYWLIRVNKGSSIRLHFIDIDLSEGQSSCYGRYVEVRDGPSRASPSLGKYCASSSVVIINSTSNALYITYFNPYYTSGRGFKLQYHAECNTVLQGYRGIIESPNFPNLYPHNRNCTWTIKAPRGNALNVSFSHLDIEDSVSPNLCEYDYVEFKMGRRFETQRVSLGSRYCGTTIPAPLATPAGMDTLLVTFVSDYTQAHNGFRLEWVVNGCGDELKKLNDSFQSPNYPNAYPPNTDCDWYISLTPGTKIEITIHDFDLESPVQSNCIFDTLKIYGGPDRQSPLLTSLCHRQNAPMVVTTQGNNALVSFHSDGSVRGGGFSISYKMLPHGCGGIFKAPTGSIHSPSYPQNYDAHTDCIWTIEVAQQHVVKLTFTDFDVEPGTNCSYDAVFVHDGDSLEAPLLREPFCGPNLPSPATIRSSSNVITVRLKADGSIGARGFTADYSTDCGATITVEQGVSGELHSPHYPHSITAGTNCAWHLSAPLGSKILLYFTHLDIQSPMSSFSHSNETCQGNFVGVYNGAFITSPLIGKYCGSRIPHAISSASSMLTVVLAVMSGQGVGFRAVYSVFGETCGGDLTSEQGEVASPDYPNSYSASQDCEWSIKAGPGNRVQMNFIEFNIEESENCNLDYIEIHEKDPAGALLAHNCGTTNPGSFIAQDSLWMKFRSDDTGTSDGFLASYSLLHGNSLYQDSGEIVSPMYPHIYMNTGTFTWTITASQNRFLYISIIDMEIEANPVIDACFSSLVVHDGPDASAPVLHTFCGKVAPTDPVIASGNIATVKFISNHRFEGSKFRLQFEALHSRPPNTTVTTHSAGSSNCSSEIYLNGSHTIRSPGYPGYPSNQDCTWTLTTDGDSSISLYLRYSLEESPTCSYDKIEIYDGIGGTRNWNLTRTVCKRQDPSFFRSSGRFFKIRFVSDPFIEDTGFVGYLRKRCGGFLTDADGIIDYSEPTWEYKCTWIIHVGIGRTIGIEFEDFRVINSSAPCGGTYITLQNGDSESSPFLGNGKYCGTQAPSIPESTTNKVRIVFLRGSGENKGFRLRYRAISQACGGSHHITPELKTIEITSPNFPHIPNPHIECEWVILGPVNKRLQIEFKDQFDITQSQGCKDAKVEIRDGGTRLSPVLAELCGGQIPNSFDSSSNALYVRYFNDLTTPHHGFKAAVKIATCGGTLYSQSGFLTSPGYPGSYDENINCTWTIVGPVGHYLALHVLNVDIANSGYNCSRPRGILQIREMNETGDLLSQLCKLNAAETKQVDTASNIASIIFKAGDNPLRKYQGFRIMYNTSKEECGGLIEASEGIIQSPGYPFGYSHRRRCDWHIRGPPGRKITIQFLDVDIRNSSYTRGNYSVHYCMEWISFRNGNPDKSTYVPSRGICNPEGNFTYSSSMNEMMLSFVTYREGNHRGFKARFTTDQPQDCGGQLEATSGTLVSPGFVDGNYNHSLYCLWTVQNPNPSNSSFVVSFPYLHLEDYCFDWIDIEGVDESGVATLIKRVCSNHAGDVLVNYPTLRITFITDSYINHIGWNMTYSLTSCGGHKKGPQDIITSPNYPQQYPNNALCAWTFEYHEGDQIKLDFTNFALEDAIDHDYVHVYNGLLPTSPLLGTYSGTTSPGIVGPSMSHNLFVTFNSDDSVSNTGFRAIASQVERGCGGIYHQSFGNFSTHGFPNDYPANSECVWEIRFQPSYHVILSFLDRFDIETSSGCQNDFVEVSNGQSENTHGPVVYTPGDKLCGKAFPPTIVSSNNAVRILFRSNDNIQGQGFKISWTQGCGSNFSASTGYIMSPNHPERYPRNANCIYGIIAPASSRVIINFITFRVEGGRQCPYDSVQIYEGSIQKYKFCGLNADEALSGPIILRSPVMLKFVSDWSVQYQGFLANYTIIPCGGNITRGGIIEVPQENIYDMYCTWDITAPEGKIVHFKFLMLHVEPHHSCDYDYVGLYNDHDETEENLIGKFCGFHAGNLPILISSSRKARVVYKTDPVINLPGFRLSVEFSYSCGGNINISREGASEEIRSLDVDHDGKYEPMITCKWLIMGLPHQVINLTFTRLDVEPPAANDTIPCPYDYVHILDGPSTYSLSLGKFCGSTLPHASIKSSSNIMYVIFHSDSVNQTAGFTATVTNALHPCGTASYSVTNTSQSLSSPGFPSAYPVNIRCRWTLRAPENQTITVHFDDFNLESSSGCSKDFLHVTDYDQIAAMDSKLSYSGSGHLISVPIGDRILQFPADIMGVDHNYCGSVVPHELNIESGFFQLTFRSDESITAPGFNVHFNLKSCNRTYTHASGSIRLSGNTTCHFTIEAPSEHFISLYFLDFNSRDESEDCSTGGIKIYDGSSAAAPNLATYCGYAIPSPVFSSSNIVFIEYHEMFVSGYANIIYTTSEQANGCGGSFVGMYHGKFSSPGYPNLQNGLDCWFTISAHPSQVVAVFLYDTNFNGNGTTNCNSTYLEIYDVSDTGNENLFSTFCGSDEYIAPHISTESRIIIHFVTGQEPLAGRGWLAYFASISDVTEAQQLLEAPRASPRT